MSSEGSKKMKKDWNWKEHKKSRSIVTMFIYWVEI